MTRFIAVHDSGRVINPPAAQGQVEGSVVQGIGFALWEALPKQKRKLFSSSTADYHQPTAPELEVVFPEDAPGPSPHGGKGIGEGTCRTRGGGDCQRTGRCGRSAHYGFAISVGKNLAGHAE